MKILITGGKGQLGHALAEVLVPEETLFTDSDDMDITDTEKVEKYFNRFKPDWLFHGAALTNVDGCEENPALAEKVNAEGTRILARACKKHGVKMVYISTDYVFDGSATSPIPEDAPVSPISVYGKTKLEGERATQKIVGGYVIRTSWVYGDGNNFVKTMLALSEKMDEIKVVSDQLGRPTFALDLANAMYYIAKKEPEVGIYNFSGDGEVISWAGFASEIFRLAGKNTKVTGITTEEYLADKKDRKIAPRPQYSAFDLTKSKTVGFTLLDWRDALKSYLGV